MDARGNLAIGYSVSSDTVYPSIRYAGRSASDPPGVLTMGEGSLVQGAESQSNSARWGDYSAMQVDPSDDCTFWYTTEYIAKGIATRIGAFRLPGCAAAGDFSISIDPASRTIEVGGSAEYVLRTATSAAVPEMLELSAAGLPTGVRASFVPAAVLAGETAALTISAGAATLPPSSFTVTAAGAFTRQSTTALIEVTARPDFVGVDAGEPPASGTDAGHVAPDPDPASGRAGSGCGTSANAVDFLPWIPLALSHGRRRRRC